MDRLRELVRLHRLGMGAREVARLLQMSPNPEREHHEALIAASFLKGPSTDLPTLEVLKTAVLEHRPPAATPAHEQSGIDSWRAAVDDLQGADAEGDLESAAREGARLRGELLAGEAAGRRHPSGAGRVERAGHDFRWSRCPARRPKSTSGSSVGSTPRRRDGTHNLCLPLPSENCSPGGVKQFDSSYACIHAL